eukprot:GHVS01037639.1.p1 GENE.GHVS01037639.1~~GHVS01037639.1.p1  ORF type:complete len:464 (-),score=103.17 GHVS01037639.1:113-1504(-)
MPPSSSVSSMVAAEHIETPLQSSYLLHNNGVPSTKSQTAATTTTTSPPSTHLVALLGADPLSPSSPILSASSPCSRFSLPAYQRRLGRLVTQRHQLRRDLAAYHKEFQERMGRCVRMQRDILPVERQYRQYTQTKEDIKKLQEAIAKLGGEVDAKVDEGRHEDKGGRERREHVKVGGEEVAECRREGLDGWHGEETKERAEQQRRVQQQPQQIHQQQQPQSKQQPHEQQSQQQQESQQPEQPHRQQQGREGRRLYTHVSRNLGTEAGDDSGTIRITNAAPPPSFSSASTSSITSLVGSNSEDATAPTYGKQNFTQQRQQASTNTLSQRPYVGCYQHAAAPQSSYMLAKGSPHIVHPPDTADLVPTQQSHNTNRGYYFPSGSSAPVGHGNNNNNAFTDPTSASSSPSNTVHRIGQASVTYGQNSSSFLLTRMHSEYQHNPQQQPLYTRQGSKTADSTLRRTPRS